MLMQQRRPPTFYLSTHEHSINITSTSTYMSLKLGFAPFSLSEAPPVFNSQQRVAEGHTQLIYGVIGILWITKVPFVGVIQHVERIGTLGIGNQSPHNQGSASSDVWEVKKVRFIPVVKLQDQQNAINERQPILSNIQAIFNEGHHYFCNGSTLSLSRPFLPPSPPSPHFIYNSNLLQLDPHFNPTLTEEEGDTPSFNRARFEGDTALLKRWSVEIIQGYVGTWEGKLAGDTVTVWLISRRSCKMNGTRYFARGINDSGHVANHTETEQIIFTPTLVVTHLQVRGSVPMFFQQVGVNGLAATLQIYRKNPFAKRAFNLHFQQLKQRYNRVMCVNLLNQGKSEERLLTQAFQGMVQQEKESIPYVRYTYFDFHQECKHDNFSNTSKLINSIASVLSSFGCNVYSPGNNSFISKQSGVVRTNCLDCLDRTNYVQSRIGLWVMRWALAKLAQVDKRQQMEDNSIYLQIQTGMNGLWADNGDWISLHYTDIGSTHSDITKTGKRTFFGTIAHKWKSLQRFYTQFTDLSKQAAISTIVGPSVPLPLPAKMTKFIDIMILSYQVDSNLNQVDKQLKMIDEKKIGVIVVGFWWDKQYEGIQKEKKDKKDQNMKDINKYIPTYDIGKAKVLDQQLRKRGYEQIDLVQGPNTYLTAYCLQSLISSISRIDKESLAPILSLQTSPVLLKFSIYLSSFIFSLVSCPTTSDLLSTVPILHQSAFRLPKYGKFPTQGMDRHQYRVIMGSLGDNTANTNNKSNTITAQQIRACRKANQSKQLSLLINQCLDNDYLSNSMHFSSCRQLKNYSQGPIQFCPARNRIIFSTQESLITKVQFYDELQNGGIAAIYSHQVKIM